MSKLSITTRVMRLDLGVLTRTGKQVLAVLAAYADGDGSNARPCIATIGAETGLGRSTILAALAHLRRIGAILATGHGHAGEVVYRVAIDHLPATPRREVGPVQRVDVPPSKGWTPPVQQAEAPPVQGLDPTGALSNTGVRDGARARDALADELRGAGFAAGQKQVGEWLPVLRDLYDVRCRADMRAVLRWLRSSFPSVAYAERALDAGVRDLWTYPGVAREVLGRAPRALVPA